MCRKRFMIMNRARNASMGSLGITGHNGHCRAKRDPTRKSGVVQVSHQSELRGGPTEDRGDLLAVIRRPFSMIAKSCAPFPGVKVFAIMKVPARRGPGEAARTGGASGCPAPCNRGFPAAPRAIPLRDPGSAPGQRLMLPGRAAPNRRSRRSCGSQPGRGILDKSPNDPLCPARRLMIEATYPL